MPPKPPSKISANTVTVSNAVVQSAQQLSLIQKRLIMAAISKLDPRREMPENPIRITAEEYAEAFLNGDISHAYEEMRNAANGILHRIVVRQRQGKRGVIIERYTWLSRADYAKGEGWIGLKFNTEIVPYLTALKSRFTSYRLEQAGALRSLYSWRILEHFQMFSGKGGDGQWQIDIEDFHQALETPQSYRVNFAQTRRFVIEPAVKELQEKDGWLIEWKPIKRGRRVTAIRFEFKRDPQGRLF